MRCERVEARASCEMTSRRLHLHGGKWNRKSRELRIGGAREAASGGGGGGSVAVAMFLGGHVDDDGAGEDEDVVFSGGDVDAVGVGHGKPALADGGDGLVVAGEGVLVVEE